MISRFVLGTWVLGTLAMVACSGSSAQNGSNGALGASATSATQSDSDADSAASRGASNSAESTPSAKAAAIATDQPEAASSAANATNQVVEEKLPSGLVVDQREAGGPAPGPPLPKGTKILHIGDSFGGALGLELNKVFSAAGLKGRLEYETATYIPTWAYSKKLPGVLQSFNPDLVLISLGANELENPEPEKRGPTIQKLIGSLGGRACVWIAPVLWEGAKGRLLEVIAEHSQPCVYLDSNRLIRKMPRALDKIHPSMAARPDWALVTARWLAYHRKPTTDRPWFIAGNP